MIKVRRKRTLLIILGLIVFILGGLSILNKSKNRMNGGENHFSGYGIQFKKENYPITIPILFNNKFPFENNPLIVSIVAGADKHASDLAKY